MRNLRTQLSMTIMLIVLFTVAVISIFSNLLINHGFEKHTAKQQKEKAESIALGLNSQYNSFTRAWNIEYIHGVGMAALADGYIIQVYDRNREIVWDAENHNMAMCAQVMQDISARMEKQRPDLSGAFISYEYDLSIGGRKMGTVTVSYYGPYFLSENDFFFLNTLNLALVIIGSISLLLSFIIGGILARRIARPLAKTAYISSQISQGNYAIRFDGTTKSKELDELAASINALATGLEQQQSLRKRLTVDIAHELRTPLTTVSSHLEAMIEGVWEPSEVRLQSCYEEIGRLSGLVMDLERLAKTESDDFALNRTTIDLLEIIRSCCDHFAVEVQKKKLTVTIGGDSSSFVCGDKEKLIQVVTNLLSNAVKYTLESGNIHLEVQDGVAESILIVEDDGIGIPPEELPLIFERFYRTDLSRSRKTGGAGIGLAIVRTIVMAHGGTVKAESRTTGGSRFIVTLVK